MAKLAEMTAVRTASIVVKRLADMRIGESNDLIDSKGGCKVAWIYSKLCKKYEGQGFPHVKVGIHGQGRILFKRSELLANYKG